MKRYKDTDMEVIIAKCIGKTQMMHTESSISFVCLTTDVINPFMDISGNLPLELDNAYETYGVLNVNYYIEQSVQAMREFLKESEKEENDVPEDNTKKDTEPEKEESEETSSDDDFIMEPDSNDFTEDFSQDDAFFEQFSEGF